METMYALMSPIWLRLLSWWLKEVSDIRSHTQYSGLRGSSHKQWVEYVREDLQTAGLSYTWWRKSQDRAGWRAAIKCLLQRT